MAASPWRPSHPTRCDAATPGRSAPEGPTGGRAAVPARACRGRRSASHSRPFGPARPPGREDGARRSAAALSGGWFRGARSPTAANGPARPAPQNPGSGGRRGALGAAPAGRPAHAGPRPRSLAPSAHTPPRPPGQRPGGPGLSREPPGLPGPRRGGGGRGVILRLCSPDAARGPPGSSCLGGKRNWGFRVARGLEAPTRGLLPRFPSPTGWGRPGRLRSQEGEGTPARWAGDTEQCWLELGPCAVARPWREGRPWTGKGASNEGAL